jgi:hypothetical protein
MTARKTPGAKKAAPRKAAKKAAPRKATKKAAPRKAPAGANSSAATATPPQAYGYYTDARMAEEVARAVFTGKFIYTPGVGWHRWTGKVWEPLVDETQPVETVRRLVVNRINYWAAKITLTDPEPLNRVYSWKAVASRHRLTAITTLARGLVEVAHEKLDAHPDLLNTPGGVVDMSTGAVRAHDQDLLLTRITRGNYRPGFTHPDVEKALNAIDEPEPVAEPDRAGRHRISDARRRVPDPARRGIERQDRAVRFRAAGGARRLRAAGVGQAVRGQREGLRAFHRDGRPAWVSAGPR